MRKVCPLLTELAAFVGALALLVTAAGGLVAAIAASRRLRHLEQLAQEMHGTLLRPQNLAVGDAGTFKPDGVDSSP